MVVQHNLVAMNAGRQLLINNKKMTGKTEKLSSGYRVNRAADDAAGLAMSEKMRRQIRGLTQASTNAQDGISLVQSAEGAMNEIHEMLQRGTELAVKAANGTLTDDDRSMVDAEIQQLKQAIDQAAHHTVFNEMPLFPTNGTSPKSMAGSQVYHYEISYRLSDGMIMIGSENGDVPQVASTGADALTESVLADKIANVLIPNAISQIFTAFPSLKNATGSDTIDMALDVSFLDGPNGTLAYAQYSYAPTGKPVNMLVKVDTADFDDDDATGTGENAETLESTIAHELMHSVMQYNLTDGMSGRTGDKYPTWFIEGTAQLAGGGFPTNWNNALLNYANDLTGAGDNSKDADITNYLKAYTVDGRPYGHGYLAAAYVGYLASGASDVTGANIAAGMDKVFSDLLNGMSLSDAINKNTGMTQAQVESLFQNPNTSLTEFVRKLSYESKNGAGSVIAGSLGAGSTNILGNTAPTQAFRIDPNQVNVNTGSTGTAGATEINLQVGAEARTHINVKLFQMDAAALGLENTSVATSAGANSAIDEFKNAVGYVSNVRSYYGAVQNRLEHTINNLDNVVENITASESRIRDTDMAKMMVEYSNQNILLQAGQAILAQANHYQDGVLALLRG